MNGVTDTLMQNMALEYFKKDLGDKINDTNQAVIQAGQETDPEAEANQSTYRRF